MWNGLPAAITAVNLLGTGIEAINGAVQNQEDTTTGITQDKAALRDDLEDQIREIGDAIYAYASAINDYSIAAQVQVTASELDTMSEQRIDDVASRIYNAGVANLAGLADYMVTQARLDALDQARQDFQAAKSKPRAKSARSRGLRPRCPR